METFTLEQFHEETCRMRKLMGDKTFWARPEDQRSNAVNGYGFCYIWLDPVGGNKLNTFSGVTWCHLASPSCSVRVNHGAQLARKT